VYAVLLLSLPQMLQPKQAGERTDVRPTCVRIVIRRHRRVNASSSSGIVDDNDRHISGSSFFVSGGGYNYD